MKLLTWLVIGLLLPSDARRAHPSNTRPKEYSFRVVHVFPHDPTAFTQGLEFRGGYLEFRGGYLYEGTGLYGRSTVRKVKLETGQILQELQLAPEYFGEGITITDERLLELTWQAQVGFVYDQASFRRLRSFDYSGEGWGLANDGRSIYMSDGTSYIRCLDPVTYSETRRIKVHEGSEAVMKLNELECVRGEIYANVWHSWRIARISPADGSVLGWIDCRGIIAPEELHEPEAVLNGIAYDPMGDRLFVTGKLWPKLYEIRLTPKP